MKIPKINVIGAGLAGSEAAFFIASHGFEVHLYEQKPVSHSPASHSNQFAELVCSNSLKSNLLNNACGLLKEEMRHLQSLTMEAAKISSIPSGQALGVDRDAFSNFITDKIKSHPNIIIHTENVSSINEEEITLIATGPLTSNELVSHLESLLGSSFLNFFDAAAPIISKESLNMNYCYQKSRYAQEDGGYLNVPLSKVEYEEFVKTLLASEVVTLHDFDHFEGCLPLEEMAKRGINTLRFGPLKAQGLELNGVTPYAVIQLRQDNALDTLYNLVGFQTNLTYAAQRNLIRSVKGLENAEFYRYGLMHRNTFIKAPEFLNRDLTLKNHPNIYIIGQLSGVEGYVESAASGLIAAYYLINRLHSNDNFYLPNKTMLGALINYLIMSNPKDFAPMNATFGLIMNCPKDKYEASSQSLQALETYITTWTQKN